MFGNGLEVRDLSALAGTVHAGEADDNGASELHFIQVLYRWLAIDVIVHVDGL